MWLALLAMWFAALTVYALHFLQGKSHSFPASLARFATAYPHPS